MFKKLLYGAAALVGTTVAALAVTWTLNLPLVGTAGFGVAGQYWPQITGYETFPADTNLSQGAQPQSVAPSIFQAASMGAAAALSTATASAGAATLSTFLGTVTTEGSLTTAAGSSYTLTLTNTLVLATSHVQAMPYMGTCKQGQLTITSITPASGSVVIVVKNTGTRALDSCAFKVVFEVASPASSN